MPLSLNRLNNDQCRPIEIARRSSTGTSCALAMAFACSGLAHFSASAQAAVTGKVVQVHATGAGNLPFRVFLENAPVLCTAGMAEGYLDDTDANYKVSVQTLLLAMTMGWPVTVYSTVGAHGRCKITYVIVNRQ